MLYVIFWTTRDYNRINAIKRFFGIKMMTVNKESVADIPPELESKFREGDALGFYKITNRPIPDYYEKNLQARNNQQPLVRRRNPSDRSQ